LATIASDATVRDAMTVRDAQPTDVDEIAALIHELAEYERLAHEVNFEMDALREHLFGARPTASVLIVEDDLDSAHAVAGFALYFPTFSTFLGRPGIWLEDLFVRPGFRGRGYGRALLQRLRELTDGRVEWAVLDWNQPAIEFYESLGARPIPGWTRYRWL
jgi:GNAT superfamily N-acetyltransferase